MSEQVAIIRHVSIGARDTNRAILTFDTYITENQVAMQVIEWDRAGELLATVGKLSDLEGAPCWVDVEPGIIKFLRLWET